MAKTKDELDFGSNVFFGKLSTDLEQINETSNDSVLEEQIAEKIGKMGEETVRQLEEQDLPPLPANYQLYFERLLEKEESSFKEKIQNVIDLQSIVEDRAVSFEKSVKEGFKSVKRILDFIAVLYKNLQLMKGLTDKHIQGIQKIDSKIALSNAIELFVKDIDKINSITSTQLGQVKELYEKTAQVIADINKNTIYDSRFGVYNQRYFISLIEKENKLIEEFNHSSSILAIGLSRNIQTEFGEKSTEMVLLKSIAKLLLKTSRRSDILGYIGEGRFAISLKYSDLESAIKAAERFVSSVKSTNIFLGDKDITLDVSIGIAKISPERSPEECMQACISALEMALDDKLDYKIFPEDEA